MWTVDYARHGGPEVLRVREVPTPRPRPGQVLVRMLASGVSRVDAEYRRGRFPHGRLPQQTGFDGIGQVVGGDGLPEGTWVCTALGLEPTKPRGTTAEFCCLEPERLGVFPAGYQPQPDDAGLILGSLTALVGLRDRLRLLPRQRLLVVGAGGAVGTSALQIARLIGADVDAVAGAAALDLCRELGASEVADHRTDAARLQTAARYDAALITAGRPSDWLGALRARGRMALADATRLPATLISARRAGIRVAGVAAGHDSDDLTWIAHRIAAGELHPVVGRRYRVDEIRRAHEELGRPGTTGARIVLHERAS